MNIQNSTILIVAAASAAIACYALIIGEIRLGAVFAFGALFMLALHFLPNLADIEVLIPKYALFAIRNCRGRLAWPEKRRRLREISTLLRSLGLQRRFRRRA